MKITVLEDPDASDDEDEDDNEEIEDEKWSEFIIYI